MKTVANTWENLKTHFFFSVDMHIGYSYYVALLGGDNMPSYVIDKLVEELYGSQCSWRAATPKEREENAFELLESEASPELY